MCVSVVRSSVSEGEISLYDFEGHCDLSTVGTENAAAAIVSKDSGKALGIELLSSAERPTVTFNLAAKDRDLSAKRYVEMDITNLSDKEAVLTFWALSGAGWGGISSASEFKTGRESLAAGETATLQIDLYGRYPGPDALATAIDPAKVKQLEIVFHLRQGGFKFAIDNIRVTGERPKEHPGTSGRLAVPEVTDGQPSPGKRVRCQLDSCKGTEIYHILCLPKNWQPGRRYPILVEYTGNVFYYKYCHSTGRTEQGNMAYGLSRGEDFICINMPFISPDGRHEQIDGWGSVDKTVDYCLATVQEVCEQYGGDGSAVIVTGFSRGLYACNYIALRNEKIADVWLAFVGDPQKQWMDGKGWNNCGIGWDDRAKRIRGRSCFLENPELGGAHVDIQYLEDSASTVATRRWLREILERRPGTSSISGKVAERDGRGIDGVRVQSGKTHFTFTDENGEYILQGLIDGKRTVDVFKKGIAFNPAMRMIMLESHDVSGVNFVAGADSDIVEE